MVFSGRSMSIGIASVKRYCTKNLRLWILVSRRRNSGSPPSFLGERWPVRGRERVGSGGLGAGFAKSVEGRKKPFRTPPRGDLPAFPTISPPRPPRPVGRLHTYKGISPTDVFSHSGSSLGSMAAIDIDFIRFIPLCGRGEVGPHRGPTHFMYAVDTSGVFTGVFFFPHYFPISVRRGRPWRGEGLRRRTSPGVRLPVRS